MASIKWQIILKRFTKADLRNLAETEGLRAKPCMSDLAQLIEYFEANPDRRKIHFPDDDNQGWIDEALNTPLPPSPKLRRSKMHSFGAGAMCHEPVDHSTPHPTQMPTFIDEPRHNDIVLEKTLLQQTQILAKLVQNVATSNRMTEDFLRAARSKKLSFSGEIPIQIITFLKDVESLRERLPISDDEMMKILPEILTLPALRFFTERRQRFRSWPEVKASLKRNYIPDGFDITQQLTIHSRTQGLNESPEMFISAVLAMNNDLIRPFSEEDLLEKMIRNLNPSYIQRVRSEIVHTISDLENECHRVRTQLERERAYVPPTASVLQHPVYGVSSHTSTEPDHTQPQLVGGRKKSTAYSAAANTPVAAPNDELRDLREKVDMTISLLNDLLVSRPPPTVPGKPTFRKN